MMGLVWQQACPNTGVMTVARMVPRIFVCFCFFALMNIIVYIMQSIATDDNAIAGVPV